MIKNRLIYANELEDAVKKLNELWDEIDEDEIGTGFGLYLKIGLGEAAETVEAVSQKNEGGDF